MNKPLNDLIIDMKKISTTYKKWIIAYEITPIVNRKGFYIHNIKTQRDGWGVSDINIYSKKKNLDPYMFFECHGLYMNSPFYREIEDMSVWEQIIRDLDLLAKVENKKK